MYKSPIDIVYGQMQTQMEGDILRAVQSYGINVDKEELIRAMQYDRDQYDKGYADGKRDAMDELVRCKDCKRWKYDARRMAGLCKRHINYTAQYDFCSYGERREGE